MLSPIDYGAIIKQREMTDAENHKLWRSELKQEIADEKAKRFIRRTENTIRHDCGDKEWASVVSDIKISTLGVLHSYLIKSIIDGKKPPQEQ